MGNPRVSFVIPLYQAQKTIVQCLEKIKESSFQDFEILVVDNNSTDLGVELVKKFSDVRILHQKIQGRSETRNLGWRSARGEIIAFIDADVLIEENWLEEMIHLFEQRDIAGAQGRIIPSKLVGKKSLNDFRFEMIERETKGSFILTKTVNAEFPMINSAACLYRREALEAVGGFDPQLKRHEDIDLAKRVALSGFNLGVTNLAQVEVIYHGDGWTDYLERAFQDGLTKNLYDKKWQRNVFTSNSSIIDGIKPLYILFTRFLKTFNWMWLAAIVVHLAKALGRVVGAIKYKNYAIEAFSSSHEGESFVFCDDIAYGINHKTLIIKSYSLEDI